MISTLETNHQILVLLCALITMGVLAAIVTGVFSGGPTKQDDAALQAVAPGSYEFVVDTQVAPTTSSPAQSTVNNGETAQGESPSTTSEKAKGATILGGHRELIRAEVDKTMKEKQRSEKATGLIAAKSIFVEAKKNLHGDTDIRREKSKTLGKEKAVADAKTDDAAHGQDTFFEFVPSDDEVQKTQDRIKNMSKSERDDLKQKNVVIMANLVSAFQGLLKEMFATVQVEAAPNKKGYYLRDPVSQKCLDVKSYVELVNALTQLQLGAKTHIPDAFSNVDFNALNSGDSTSLKENMLRACSAETTVGATSTGELYVNGKPLRFDVIWPADSSLLHTSALKIVNMPKTD